MVEKIQSIEISITRSETEALLLEQSLIKTYRPFYNIQLRDDKSYPYIRLTSKDTYPRLTFYRGSRKVEGKLFGPYPSANSTRETLQILQKFSEFVSVRIHTLEIALDLVCNTK